MGPREHRIHHVTPAGYARAGDAEPDDERAGNSRADFEQEKKATSSTPSWWLEIAALLLCICTTVSTVVLLVTAHGKPSNIYLSFISFNTIVSIFSTVIRVSLGFALGSCLGQWKWNWFRRRPDSLAVFEGFEDASRGPWGSLTLIANFKVRHWAALGAFFTVIMLGFEPFLQSTIRYEGYVRERLGNASKNSPPTLSGGDKVDAGKYKFDSMGTIDSIDLPSGHPWFQSTFSSRPDPSLPIAMYSGFSQTLLSAQQTASFSCSTGNCTWDIFTSVSVCSKCNDVTHHLKKETINGQNLGTIKYDKMMTIRAMPHIVYSLPYLNISNLAEDEQPSDLLFAFMTAKPISNPGRTLTFTQLDTMISAVGIIKADVAFAEGRVLWKESHVTATECALSLCTKAYSSVVVNGVLKEDTIASWENRVPGSYRYPPDEWVDGIIINVPHASEGFDEVESVNNRSLVIDPIEYGPNAEASRTPGDVYRSDLQLSIPADEARAHGIPDNASLLFNITQNTVGSMGRFINFGFFQIKRNSMVWPISNLDDFGQTPVAQSLWNSPDLSVTFDNVARTMSNWMRDSTGQTQFGTLREHIIVIRVQWVYLPVPVVVVVAGCVFVLFTIWETKRLQLPAWRSSVMSTLTHSLDAESRFKLRQADLDGALKMTSKETMVYLDDASDGLQLKVHND